MHSLVDLVISLNKITTLGANMFSALTSLTNLDLSNNRMSSIHLKAFQGLQSLTDLILRENKLNVVHRFLQPLKSLNNLDLSSNAINKITEKAFIAQSRLGQIFLEYNQLEYLRVGMFEGLGNLDALDIHGNVISWIEEGNIYCSLFTIDIGAINFSHIIFDGINFGEISTI